ncbi:hypothetical protein, partial [Flagellimonas marinaquae]
EKEPAKEDLRKAITASSHSQEYVCSSHFMAFSSIIESAPPLLLSRSHTVGWMEPLLPPLRHHATCYNQLGKPSLSLNYLIHDFGQLCGNLKVSSKIVFLDLGATLFGPDRSPALQLTDLFTKMGFFFDHVYAFEMKPFEPSKVYEMIPQSLMPAYHWINVGVSANPVDKLNPFYSILAQFHKDDLVLVKLDIDTPTIELPLAHQLLEDQQFHDLVDLFYFEHHVHLKELAKNWHRTMSGTLGESLTLFQQLRKKGIGAHYWP